MFEARTSLFGPKHHIIDFARDVDLFNSIGREYAGLFCFELIKNMGVSSDFPSKTGGVSDAVSYTHLTLPTICSV